jgi:hypothetical protein
MGYQLIQAAETMCDGRILVVSKDGKENASTETHVGVIQYTYTGETIKLCTFIKVAPAHRRRGVATLMLDHLHDRYPGKRLEPGPFSDDGRRLFVTLVGRRNYFWEWLVRGAQGELSKYVPDRDVEPAPPSGRSVLTAKQLSAERSAQEKAAKRKSR